MANGSCRMEIARPKGTVVSIIWYAKTMSSSRGAKLGSLSNHNDGNKNPTNLHIWQWKTVFLHLHFSPFDILKMFSFFLWHEMTFFSVVWTTRAYDDKCSKLSYVPSTNLVPRVSLLLHPLVVGTETLIVAGHVTTQNLGGRKICWEPEKYQGFNGKIWTQQIDLAPNVWLHSSVGRVSHW